MDNRIQLANQYYDERNWDEALLELGQVLNTVPDHNEAKVMQNKIWAIMNSNDLQEKGIRIFNNGSYFDALNIFKQIVENDPENSTAKSYLNDCQAKLNKRIAELFNSGMQFYTGGNYDAAIREWSRILEIDPNHKSALDYKTRATERLEALEKLQ